MAPRRADRFQSPYGTPAIPPRSITAKSDSFRNPVSMAGRIKHRSRDDFRLRIKRVDPAFYRGGVGGALKDTTAPRPVGATLLGFGWAYLVIAIAGSRATSEQSLRQGTLPDQYHGYIFMTLAALLAISLVMLAVHVFRFVTKRGGKRTNSGGLLIGVLGALVLVYTPESVWNTGFQMMDGNSRSLLLTASATVGDVLPGVDFGAATLVSSFGK